MFVSVERLAAGGLTALYPEHPETTRPFLVTPYFPAFYLEWAALRALLGGQASMLPGRALSLTALLAAASLLAALIHRSRAPAAAALAFTLTWLASPLTADAAALATTDVAALAWSAAGVWLTGARRAARAPAWPAALPFAAALLTKQSSGAGLVAATAFLLLERRSRDAAAVSFGAIGATLAVAATLDWATHGGFIAATVGGLRQPLLRAQLGHVAAAVASEPLPWVLLALSIPAVPAAFRANGWTRLPALYAMSALALAVALAAKAGSDTNYFLEPTFALAWTAALGSERLVRGSAELWRAAPFAAAALAAGAGLLHVEDRLRSADRSQLHARRAERQLAAIGLKGWVIAPTTLYPVVERLGGRVYVNDPYLFALFWESGAWPVDAFLADLTCGRVRLIVGTSFSDDRPSTARRGLEWEGWSFWNSPLWAPIALRTYGSPPGPPDRAVDVRRPRDIQACDARTDGGPSGLARATTPQPMRPASRNEK